MIDEGAFGESASLSSLRLLFVIVCPMDIWCAIPSLVLQINELLSILTPLDIICCVEDEALIVDLLPHTFLYWKLGGIKYVRLTSFTI